VFGKSIIVAYARAWRDHSGRAGTRAQVTLIDRHAEAAKNELYARYPVVRQMCDIDARDKRLTDFLAEPAIGPYHRSFVCYEDEHEALTVALSAVTLWRGGQKSLVVRLNRLAQHGEAFTDSRFDNLDKRLAIADVANLAATQVARDVSLAGTLAKIVHARYLQAELARGVEMGSRRSMHDWDDLPADLKRDNLAQVADFSAKLKRLGCTISPRSALVPVFELSDDEIEREAILEHERWMTQRRADGWTYDEEPNDRKKRSNALLDWPELDETNRNRDRDAIRNLLAYDRDLGDFGLQIVRLPGASHRRPDSSIAARKPSLGEEMTGTSTVLS
jgi:hypothetical protein